MPLSLPMLPVLLPDEAQPDKTKTNKPTSPKLKRSILTTPKVSIIYKNLIQNIPVNLK
jgi:hypothetical protein